VASQLSLADVAVFQVLHAFSDPNDAFFITLPYVDDRLTALESFPLLMDHMVRVYKEPQIRHWYETRPEGLF